MSPRLHSYFTPGMMLQRDVPTTVWSYEAMGEVTAALACQEDMEDMVRHMQVRQALVTRTREDGVWQAELPPWPAGSICQFEVRVSRRQGD